MKPRGLTIVSRIDAARVADLDAVLRQIGDTIGTEDHIPFDDLTLLHFVSWVVFENNETGPQLIFESNFDGSAEIFLRQLAERARSGLNEIYQYCEDYPAGGDADAVCATSMNIR